MLLLLLVYKVVERKKNGHTVIWYGHSRNDYQLHIHRFTDAHDLSISLQIVSLFSVSGEGIKKKMYLWWSSRWKKRRTETGFSIQEIVWLFSEDQMTIVCIKKDVRVSSFFRVCFGFFFFVILYTRCLFSIKPNERLHKIIFFYRLSEFYFGLVHVGFYWHKASIWMFIICLRIGLSARANFVFVFFFAGSDSRRLFFFLLSFDCLSICLLFTENQTDFSTHTVYQLDWRSEACINNTLPRFDFVNEIFTLRFRFTERFHSLCIFHRFQTQCVFVFFYTFSSFYFNFFSLSLVKALTLNHTSSNQTKSRSITWAHR